MTEASDEPQPLLVSAKTCYFCKEVIIRYATRVHESRLNVLPFLQVHVQLFTTGFLNGSGARHVRYMKCVISVRKASGLHGFVAVSKGYTSEASQVPDLAVDLAFFLLTCACLELE